MTGLDAVRARFARNESLPDADILTQTRIRDVLNEHGVNYRDRAFNPVTTIWGLLSQVLSEDHSCRDAVSRIIAHRAANGDTICSSNTASYCNAKPYSHRGTIHFGNPNCPRAASEHPRTVEVEWSEHSIGAFQSS